MKYLIIMALVLSAKLSAKELTITTLNIRWYGLGGEFNGHIGDEYRDKYLDEYLFEHTPKTDVFVFQEIVDTDRLSELMVRRNYNCLTYHRTLAKHQHVMFCVSKSYKIVRAPREKNFEIEESAIDKQRSRPALHGVITDLRGKKLIHLLGLHLKARPDHSRTRMKQIEAIGNYLKSSKISIPTVMVGDYNAFTARQTGNPHNDMTYFEKFFKVNKTPMKYVRQKYRTYVSGKVKSQLDHLMYTDNIEVKGFAISEVCKNYTNDAKRFKSASYYRKFVSDHCRLSYKLSF